MQIESLKLFCDAVRFRSFSKAAEESGVTQSTASQAVHGLEERLGVTLIDRSQRPWQLTNEGNVFHEGCRQIVDRYFELESQVRSLKAKTRPVVRVASIYSVGLRHMTHYVQRFAELHPGVDVHLDYLRPDRVYESLRADGADLGIVSFPQGDRDIAVIPWRMEPMALACPPDHPLAKAREVKIPRLTGEKFISFDKDLTIRAAIDRYLKRNGAQVETALEFDNIEAIKQAVEIGTGVSILPRPTLDKEVRGGSLAAVQLSPGFSRPLGILQRRGKKFNPHVAQFVELLKTDEGKNRRVSVKSKALVIGK